MICVAIGEYDGIQGQWQQVNKQKPEDSIHAIIGSQIFRQGRTEATKQL